MFNINAAALPTLRTRQALLILDLQNEFVSPDGALTIKQPDVVVSRVIQLAKAFRLSGAGDVIWIRTQFDGHRPLSGGADGGDQIITTDAPIVPRRSNSSRGRQPTSGRHEEAVMEADEEAFLSYPPACEKPQCVLPGSDGAQLAPEVQQAVDVGRDIQFTKTHYSAFAAGQQLVQLLRGRFVTEIYVCGALTNISIYATALDAGRHGYDITLVDDCCGYRSDMRHSNAVHRLMQLTGCEVTTSSDIMAKLKPEKPSSEKKAKRRGAARDETPGSSRRRGSKEAAGRSGSKTKEPAVGQPSPEDEDDPLPSSFERLTLSGPSAPAPAVSSSATTGALPQRHRQDSGPTAQQPIPTVVERSNPAGPPETRPPVTTAKPTYQTTHVNPAPLEVDPDLGNESTPHDGDSSTRKGHFDVGQKLQYIRSNQVRGPPRILIPPNSALGSVRSAAAKARMQSRQPPGTKDTTSSSSNASVSTASDASQPGMEGEPTPTPSEPLCEGDTTIITNLLPPSLAATAFDRLKSEVYWQHMSHQGGEVPRLVAVQGEVDHQGDMPAYRHPSDESPPLLPFTPTVSEIRRRAEAAVGHPLNHVLIQLYRSGGDYISEHSDKTLDIVRGSFIANVSLGAERTMVFRTKRPDKDPSWLAEEERASDDDEAPRTEEQPAGQTGRVVVRAPLPHNSLCRMGPATNSRWLHAIRPDKRADRDKTPAELARSGARISLTFRHIGTFLDATRSRIWGQGATSKTRDSARTVINGQTPQAVAMLRAFGAENRSSRFDWEGYYGGGFDVLDISASPRLYFSRDWVVNARAAMMLGYFGVGFAKGSTGAPGTGGEAVIKFVDNDGSRTGVEGGVAVMLYLDAVYGKGGGEVGREEVARRYMRFQAALGLGERWRLAIDTIRGNQQGSGEGVEGMRELGKEMEAWDGYAREAGDEAYIAGGKRMSIADFALWPVLHDVVTSRPGFMQRFEYLMGYYERLKRSKAGLRALGGGEGEDNFGAETRKGAEK